MKKRWLAAGVVAVLGVGVAAYMLKPVSGPARDLTLVGDAERGNYVLRLGGCVACHTNAAAGGAELAGGVGLETQFGTFVPPNITADPEAGIGAWTVEQFSAAMSDGMGPQGHLYPAFPYENYTLMSDKDVVDLYAALMASEPVSTPSAQSEIPFPFNMRLLMAGWKNLFFSPGRFVPEEGRDEVYNRGKYLAMGPAHCVACHTPRNALGALEWDKAFTGSPGGTGGRAPALTREALVAEGYDVETLAQTLKDGFTPGFDVLGGPMGEVIADSTAHWTDEDLTAVSAYLLAE
ncbi:Cytochrome c, mono-and diheme variants [Devosia crocina]|uniref:Cytochrome c, mono-and diheme variants n=1 Tax=Devosia crocina TaxID=429728 RepID=A0A1I7MVU1_9HYPH|nr:cytochrome c [Devosia crocina]SFV26495.1 Cytochrome c, mono-and diheme variants [Devosia crocina]